MENSISWVSHVEAFVDSSRPPSQQAASVDAIAALVKKDLLTLEALVREMELYLTISDHLIRARGILLLAEILTRLIAKPLDSSTVSTLVEFFTSRLADWQALRGALIGCLALLMRRKNVGMIKSSDVRALAQSFLANVQVQSLAVHDRKLCFEVLQCLLDDYPEAVLTLGDELVYGICEAIDEEKDPRCLMLTFHLVEILARLFPDPSGSVASFAEDIFEILSRYFPIYFTHPSDDVDIKRDDLSTALMHAFCSTPFFEPFVVPLLLHKLSSSLPLAKLDSLKYLNNCIRHYGADRMVKHGRAIWSGVKDVIFNLSPQKPLLLVSESTGDIESEENQIVKEALNCLQTAIFHLDSAEKDPFLSLILEDTDIETKFGSVGSEGSYTGISMESQCHLSALGKILSISSRVSKYCCHKVFQKFFPRLMCVLGVCSSSSSHGHSTSYRTVSSNLNFGALYLCVELLASCGELTLASQDLSPQLDSVRDMLQQFSGPLSYALGSALLTAKSAVVVNGKTEPEHACCVVKGLQVLATLPGCYSPVSEDVFEDILGMLMSAITEKSEDIFLWKLSLKALVQIGSSVEKIHDFVKGKRYSEIVVEGILSLLLSDDTTMSLASKLDVISEIGTAGMDHMLRIIRGLEEAVFSNFLEACVKGNHQADEILVPMLECYSNLVLSWCWMPGNSDEIAVQFVVRVWTQIESTAVFKRDVEVQGLLNTMVMAMKVLVGCCKEENQSFIVQKAYVVVSSRTFLSVESLPFSLCKLEGLQPLSDSLSLSCRDEWLISLFASVVIALRPQTLLPDVKEMIKLFMVFLFRGHMPAAQALASILNKWPADSESKVLYSCTLDEAIEMIIGRSTSSLSSSPFRKCSFLDIDEKNLSWLRFLNTRNSFEIHPVVGLAWIGKGLLMRGHEMLKEIAMLLFQCLLPSQDLKINLLLQQSGNGDEMDVRSQLAMSAGDAFHILLSDSEACLNKKFHATIRPLYKQRFFSSMMPVLLSSIKESDSSTAKVALYRALGHLLSDTPLPAVVSEAKKIIPSLVDILAMLSPDITNKDLVYSLLLVLSGILMDDNGQEAVLENTYTIISHLTRLISYPHMMLVRETAVQCLVAMSGLPHTRIYPMRTQVLRAVSKALDDRKRAVRQEAVRCRQAWGSIASRSLHF